MVFNQTVDLWEALQGLAHFFVHEACGQCTPCRLGTKQIYNILNKIRLGTATSADLNKMEKLGETVKKTCVCGLGMTAANPVLTVMHHFGTATRV
jgi:NADH:ubiquinone oxidoreductase subunit F (NADH-binding)